jgi:hypothetical protein
VTSYLKQDVLALHAVACLLTLGRDHEDPAFVSNSSTICHHCTSSHPVKLVEELPKWASVVVELSTY